MRLGRQSISLFATAIDDRYSRHSGLDDLGLRSSLVWDWRLASRVTGEVGAGYSRWQAGFADTSFLGPDLLTTRTAHGQIDVALGPRLNLVADGRGARVTHSAVERQENDHESFTGRLALVIAGTGENEIGFEGGYVSASFPHPGLSPVPTVRGVDFDELSAGVRLRYAPGSKLMLQGRAARLRRSYEGLADADIRAFVWRASAQWQFTPKTGVEFNAWRDLTASVDSAADAYFGHGLRIAPRWQATRAVAVALGVGRERQRYVGTPAIALLRRDAVVSGEVQLELKLREDLTFTLTGRAEDHESTLAVRAFEARQAVVELRYTW